MCEAIVLAKYIVSKCMTDGKPISNLRLQKTMYYIQKDFIKRGNEAFMDDIEAWQFGPVVPNVYYRFSGYGSMPITAIYEDSIVGCYSTSDINTIDTIIESKRELDPWDMVEETHKANGAWDRVFKNGLGNHNVIPKEFIREDI